MGVTEVSKASLRTEVFVYSREAYKPWNLTTNQAGQQHQNKHAKSMVSVYTFGTKGYPETIN